MTPTLNPNALFAPAKPLGPQDLDFLAGRSEQVTALIDAVAVSGATVAIFGDRGVGKTSLALVAQAAINGDKGTLDRFRLAQPRRAKALWIECEPSMGSIGDVLATLAAYPDRALRDDADRQKLRGLATLEPLDGRGASLSAAFERWTDAARVALDVDELVLFVDEFERLPKVDGVASLVKNATSFKLVLVGVGESVNELARDHPSMTRQLQPVFTPALSRAEIKELFASAERRANANGKRLAVTSPFVDRVTEASRGYPYVAQRIGHHAVSLRRGDMPVKLDAQAFETALTALYAPNNDSSGLTPVERALGDAMSADERGRVLLTKLADVGFDWTETRALQTQLPIASRRYFSALVDRLIEAKLIRRSSVDDRRIRFDAPEILLMTKLAAGLRHGA